MVRMPGRRSQGLAAAVLVLALLAGAGCAAPLASSGMERPTARPFGAIALGLRAVADRLRGLSFSLVIEVQDADADFHPLAWQGPPRKVFFEEPTPLTLFTFRSFSPVTSHTPRESARPAQRRITVSGRGPEPRSLAALPSPPRYERRQVSASLPAPDIIMQ